MRSDWAEAGHAPNHQIEGSTMTTQARHTFATFEPWIVYVKEDGFLNPTGTNPIWGKEGKDMAGYLKTNMKYSPNHMTVQPVKHSAKCRPETASQGNPTMP
jgi:hypothetical protein